MTDRDALFAAICAQPDEDMPRLAFADFLQEEGGKENAFRAEYIRGAIRVAREELWSPAWKAANKKWEKYATKVRSRASDRTLPWVAHLRGRVVVFEFDRGFVGHVTVYSKRFVAEGERFFAQDPIRSVKFASLDSKSGSVPLKQLLACPHLARVAKLGLETTSLGDKDLALMGGAKNLAGLRSLTLSGNQGYTPKGLAKLLQDLPAIDELQVTVFGMYSAQVAEALAAAPGLAKLKSLNLSDHYASAKGVAAILGSKHLAKLRELWLSLGNDYDEEHGHQLMDRRRFKPKEGEVVAAALAAGKFPNLRFLDLTGCMIGDAGVAALAAKGRFPSLRQLVLDDNNVTREGLKVLADSAAGKQLVYLGIGFSPKLENAKVMKDVWAMFPNATVSGYGVW
jgi:uncharacterized protein (TIGR02996 family)